MSGVQGSRSWFSGGVKEQQAQLARQGLAWLTDAAKAGLAQAQATNRQALGHDAPYRQVVDGVEGAPFEAVKPGGRIEIRFELLGQALNVAVDDAIAMYRDLSPVGTQAEGDEHPGRARDSLLMSVDGGEAVGISANRPLDLAAASVVLLFNRLPYARRIERGASDQAPNGVFNVIASALDGRHGQRGGGPLAVAFEYGPVPGGSTDYPLIRLAAP